MQSRVVAHPFRHGRPFLLPRLYAVGGMEVHGHLQLVVLDPAQESLGVGEEGAVPCVTRPSASRGLIVMPVHVDHKHVERNVILMEVVHELTKLVIRIAPIARPPVAEGITRWQRHLA